MWVVGPPQPCIWHNPRWAQDVVNSLEAAGHTVLFRPAYSPDLGPIEMAFHDVSGDCSGGWLTRPVDSFSIARPCAGNVGLRSCVAGCSNEHLPALPHRLQSTDPSAPAVADQVLPAAAPPPYNRGEPLHLDPGGDTVCGALLRPLWTLRLLSARCMFSSGRRAPALDGDAVGGASRLRWQNVYCLYLQFLNPWLAFRMAACMLSRCTGGPRVSTCRL